MRLLGGLTMADYVPGLEVRITSDTGGEKGQKDERFGGGDPLAFAELARVYGFGEHKYARYNYLRGYAWSLSVDALFRHLFAFLAGEDRDPESGLLHTAHVAWHAQTLTSFQLRGLGTDDRFSATDPTEGEEDEGDAEPFMCCACPGAYPHDGMCLYCEKHSG